MPTIARVVSNDSDIAEAMRLVREQRRKRIGLVTPGTGSSQQLKKYADFARHIRPNGLRHSSAPSCSCRTQSPAPTFGNLRHGKKTAWLGGLGGLIRIAKVAYGEERIGSR